MQRFKHVELARPDMPKNIKEYDEGQLEEDSLQQIKKLTNKTIPGIGHPSIKGEDPRVIGLLNSFKDIAKEKVNFYIEAENHLSANINIGGAMCALMLDAGIKKEYVLYFPLIGRLFGWCEIHSSIKKNFKKVVPSNIIINENN